MPLSDGNFALGKADVSKQDLGKTDTTAHKIVQVRGYVDFMSNYIANSHVLFFFLSSTLLSGNKQKVKCPC